MRRLTRSLTVALVCMGPLLLGVGATVGAAPASKPATHTVVIEGAKFDPATLTVKSGDTVVWLNKDPYPHSVTADGVFDSHSIPANGSWTYTPRKAGKYDYICARHTNMTGSLIVQ